MDSKVALVTGANRGLGFEIARQLAERGHSVLLGSRDASKGETAAGRIDAKKGRVSVVELDVTDQSTVDDALRSVRSEFGRLDILVNNAGILLDDTDFPSQTKLENARSTIETNLLGPWRLCQAFIPLMRQNHYGRIVNVSSGAGALESLSRREYSPAYSLSKASLNAMTMMLAHELRGTNILVNAVCPGWVRTDMGGLDAPRSVEQGADTAVWLAMLPDDGPTGGFFRDRTRIPW